MNEFELAGYAKDEAEKLMNKAMKIAKETTMTMEESIGCMLKALRGEIRCWRNS